MPRGIFYNVQVNNRHTLAALVRFIDENALDAARFSFALLDGCLTTPTSMPWFHRLFNNIVEPVVLSAIPSPAQVKVVVSGSWESALLKVTWPDDLPPDDALVSLLQVSNAFCSSDNRSNRVKITA